MMYWKRSIVSSKVSTSDSSDSLTDVSTKINVNDSFIENENKHRRITIVRPHTTEVKTQLELALELEAEQERNKPSCFGGCLDTCGMM